MQDTVIAVDPGREKCGVAVVDRGAGLLWKAVVQTQNLPKVVTTLAEQWQVATVVIGNRTGYRAATTALAPLSVGDESLQIIPVDEHRSSDEARARYWIEHKPQGILRVIPVTMRTPPVPVDDYVALILAERYFAATTSRGEKQ